MQQRAELPALTGLRGICALWVLGFHAFTVPAGYLGVDVFFALSGFVLAYNYAGNPPSVGVFLWKRFARLYPAHLAGLALTVVCVLVLAGLGIDNPRPGYFKTEGLLRSLLMVHAWQIPVGKTWNVPSWSISAEWAAYLAFPVLAAIACRARQVLPLLALVAALYAWLGYEMATGEYYATVPYGMHRIAAGFTAGVLMYRVYELAPPKLIGMPALFALLGGSMAVDTFIGRHESLPYFPVLSAVVVYGLARSDHLSSPVALYLGRISYSLYLVHWPLLWLSHSIVKAYALPNWPVKGVTALLGLVLAAAVYRWIEVPARRWLLTFRVRSGRLRNSEPAYDRAR
jgi:peptidoglycan/LPS O-acetylase OafA/YrhL